MAIALGLDPAPWTTGTATTIVSAAFSPVANSLIIVASHIDAATAPTISDSVGLTWTAIGTAQGSSTGGRTMAWWAYTATARTNMTVSVNWASAATKSIKVVTWTGTASASAVISKAQSTSTVTPLNIAVTTSNNGCRIAGTAMDWNARGGPTSSDDEVSYTVLNQISGTTVHKATNSSGVGTSVTLNIVKGTVNASAADWGYKVYEIVPAAGGASSVTLTPATVTSSAVTVTPIPQPVTLTLTPVTITSSAVSLSPIPQPVTLTLTPATVTLSAIATTPTGGGGGGGGTAVFYTDADAVSSANFDDSNVSLATEMQLPAGTITKIRWRAPAIIGATTPLARLYDSSGTLLASASFDTLTTDAWNYATLSSPITIAAGTYYPTVYCNRYRAISGFYAGGSITRGSFTAVQGRWLAADARPTNTSTAAYLVDAEFTANVDGSSTVALTPAVMTMSAPAPVLPLGGVVNQSSGVAPRNGTASHTIPFGFTTISGNELVVFVFGAVTHAASGWTERLQPVSSGELSVFTKTSAGESSITVTHNASDYAVNWAVYELPAGSSWINGIGDAAATSDTFPVLGSLPGTPVMVWAARGRVAGDGGATAGASTWTLPWIEDADVFAATDVTNGAYLTVARQVDFTGTTITPSTATTYTGVWTTAGRQHVAFAMTIPTITPPTVTAGVARPVVNSGSVLLDVITTPPGGQTITGHSWAIQSGGGSLTNATTSTPTYAAPSSGTGVAIIRDTVTASGGGTATADVRVGYGPNIVAADNALPGTARATWDLSAPNWGGVNTLQGFCDGFTANKSETVNFKIAQSDTAGWTADIYRLGYYSGTGARFYGTLTPNGTQLTASQAQPAPGDADASTTKLSADCGNWSTTLTWTPPSWVPSGTYILRLNRTGGGASHVMFILRDDSRSADLMFMPADSTWDAYNAFGGMGANLLTGNSLYWGTVLDQYNTDAARFVSYNRPFVNRAAVGGGYGAVQWSTFFTGEYPMLRFLERNGFDVKYYGCIDAAGDPTGAKLSNVNAAMFVGHSEYWSDGMRSGWEAAKAAGTNVFSCASNEVFWRLVGTDPDASGRPRTWECQKSTIGGRGNTRPEWTGTWRDPDGAGKGGNNPENTFTGTIYVVNGADLRSLAVPFDGGYAAQPLWRHCSAISALTAGQTWTSPDQIVGFEWDTYGPAGTSNTGGNFMAAPHAQARYCSSATYTLTGPLLIDAGDVYGNGTATHRLVVHPGGNGAITFGTGTINWAFGVDDANVYQVGNDNTSVVIQQATVNMLVDMSAAPATLMAGLTAPTQTVWFTGASSVALTPAVMTTTAPAVTATPQPSAITLTTVTRTITAVAVTAAPQPVVITLTPVSRTITAVAVTATPQPVIITLSPAVTTTAAVVLSIGGVGGTTLTPAVLTATASSVIATPGVVTTTLTLASTTTAAIPLGVTPIAVTITLTPAVMTVTALGVGLGAVGAATLTPAQLTTSARTLTATPGPMSITLTTATITFAVPTVIATPGAININISIAQATILLNPVSFSAIPTSAITLVPAQLALSTLSGVYVTKPGVDLMTIAFVTVTGVGEYIRGELVDTEGGVPKRFAHVVPGQIAWDNCDCGQFAQTINSVASSRNYPTPASDAPDFPCGHPLAVVSVTLSLLRCVPGLDSNGNAPDVFTLMNTARVIEEDRQVLRRSVAQYLKSLLESYQIVNYTVGVAQSVGPEGQCGGIELAYSFGINNDAVVC